MNAENAKPHLVYQEYKIDQQPWPQYQADNIEAMVRVAYSPGNLFLEFIVAEPFVQATYRNANGEVYKDSCVEFFVRFDNDNDYYNLEWNVLGNIRFSYGHDRKNRSGISADVINKIERKLFFRPYHNKGSLLIEWRLTAILPLSVFIHHSLKRLEDHQVFGNFYKCGDSYDQPHYLSWSAIRSEHPDFHRPEYFRSLSFNKEP